MLQMFRKESWSGIVQIIYYIFINVNLWNVVFSK